MRTDRVRARRRAAVERWTQLRRNPLASERTVIAAFGWMVAWDRAYNIEQYTALTPDTR